MELDLIYPLIFGFAIHFLLMILLRTFLDIPYEYKKLEKKEELKLKYDYYISNYYCILHAVTMALYGGYCTYNYNDMNRQVNDLDKKMLLFSVGYNIFDLIYEYKTKILVSSILFHHMTMIFMNSYTIYFDKFVYNLSLIYFIGEITNPFLCLHQNLGSYKNFKYSSQIFSLIYCPIFIFVRIFVSGYLFVNMILNPYLSFFYTLTFSLMFFIGIQWSFQTLNKFFKDLSTFLNEEKNIDMSNPYEFTNKLRYSNKFQTGFKVFTFTLCVVPNFLYQRSSLF